MKSFIGIILIVFGLITLAKYPNLGRDMSETIGAIFGIGLVTFLPAYFLIKSDNKSKNQ